MVFAHTPLAVAPDAATADAPNATPLAASSICFSTVFAARRAARKLTTPPMAASKINTPQPSPTQISGLLLGDGEPPGGGAPNCGCP
jgi:hypothetical protein